MPIKFEVSLVYIESSRTARLLGGNPTSKPNKQIRKNKQINNKTLTKNNKSTMRSVASLSSLLREVERWMGHKFKVILSYIVYVVGEMATLAQNPGLVRSTHMVADNL